LARLICDRSRRWRRWRVSVNAIEWVVRFRELLIWVMVVLRRHIRFA
jgi:hypothetical protein